MRIRAVAVASERSRAIGSVELECLPSGLSVTYLGLGAFSDGYAPGALTHGTSLVVPWDEVVTAALEGEALYLELASARTPHKQLHLARFSSGDLPDPRELARQRWVLRVGAAGAAIVAVLVTTLSLPRVAPRAGAVLGMFLALLVSGLVLGLGSWGERWLARGAVEGAPVREAFAVELGHYLPSLARRPAAERAPRPLVLPTFQGLLPRGVLAVAITLTACALGALLTASRALEPTSAPAAQVAAPPEARAPHVEPASAPEPDDSAAPTAAVQAPTAAPTPVPATDSARGALTTGAPCTCARSDSSLWREPPPKLALLLLSLRTSGDQRKRTTVELAAVNDSDTPLSEIALRVDFYDVDPPPSNRRYAVGARALYFQGPLAPGAAIKWSATARGSDVSFENPLPGSLGAQGEGAAPANLLFDLLKANHRPVRLHGARLLAFLGDPRAPAALAELVEAGREEEAPFLSRVASALRELRVCDVKIDGPLGAQQLAACVHNTGQVPVSDTRLTVRALGGAFDPGRPTLSSPSLLADAALTVPGVIAAGAGLHVAGGLPLSLEAAPVSYEVAAE